MTTEPDRPFPPRALLASITASLARLDLRADQRTLSAGPVLLLPSTEAERATALELLAGVPYARLAVCSCGFLLAIYPDGRALLWPTREPHWHPDPSQIELDPELADAEWRRGGVFVGMRRSENLLRPYAPKGTPL